MQVKQRKLSEEILHGIDPMLDRIYRGRGIVSSDQVDYGLSNLLSFQYLHGIDQACSLLYQSIQKQIKVIIIGDYDVDGATATSVLVSGLKDFGFLNVGFIIPNRMVDGYGLTPVLVDRAHEQGADLIITVDNGIVSYQGVDRANEIGLSVIITDHHLAGDTLPDAIIVNPNQPDCSFSSKSIAGVGVAFYLLVAFRAYLRGKGYFKEQEPSLMKYMDLVALGTVADCVPLDHNNRLMITHGLALMRAKKARPGIMALLSVAKRNPLLLEASDMGFSVGPRLNAAGRLDDMSIGVRCLLSTNQNDAMQYALRLDGINVKRRQMQSDMLEEALRAMESISSVHDGMAVVYHKDWHEGIIGLVASMIKERYHIPVIALSLDGSGQLMKGSCRSVPGLNIRDVLADFDSKHPGVLLKFGGHAMAAGLSIKLETFKFFEKEIKAICNSYLTPSILQKELLTDGSLPTSYRTITFARKLLHAGPWGNGFEDPCFHDTFDLHEQYLVGGKHLKVKLGDGEKTYDGIWFNSPKEQWPKHDCSRVDVVYTVQINEFNGKRTLQFLVILMQVA